MEIVRSQCAHAMPPIAKDRDRPRSVSNREISPPSDQATSDEDLTRQRAPRIACLMEMKIELHLGRLIAIARRLPMAVPRGLSATSHPRGGPVHHVSFAPRQHRVCGNKKNFFRDFKLGKPNEN